jgi:GNAT superfamily N-acetyltransferase
MGRGVIEKALLVVPDEPGEADRAAILAGLAAFNRRHVDPGATGSLAVLLKDDDGNTIGGLWGTILFGWLQIELLFLPEDWRGKSLGSAIVERAEALAIARGCIGASLDTYSFQARGFYEKLGYRIVGTIANCPPEGARHFLQKCFHPADSLVRRLIP